MKRFLLTLRAIAASTWVAGCGSTATHSPAQSDASVPAAPSTKIEFTSQPQALVPGRKVSWTIKVSDVTSGQPKRDFGSIQGELMPLIVVSRDLSWFDSLRPQSKGNGLFTVAASLPRPGIYKMYAQYTARGQQPAVAQHEVAIGKAAPGEVAPESQLVPDKMRGAWMMKQVTSHLEGEPGGEPEQKARAEYEVALMPMPMQLKAGEDATLHFQIRNASGEPLSDLQPYLGALGRCVVIARDASKYLHALPVAEGGASSAGVGPDVMFHTIFPEPGLYKAWGEFKRNGQIITAPFVLSVAAADA